jgi:lipoprotein-anchoring transpeptidase ErfK/SrfK
VAALALLTAACSGSGHSASQARDRAAEIASEVKITPANGAGDADPSAGITVTAKRGTLKNVTVHTSGEAVPGTLSQDRKVWHSQWALAASQGYTVTATAAENGGIVAATSTFRTLTPGRTFRTEIFEGYHQTYGVGMPIMLIFSQPITDKAAVERSLQLTTSKPVVGAWYWDDSEHLNFRPRDYWPAGTQVSFTGHLNGVQGAPGMYATADLTQAFNIGASLIALVSTTDHHMRVYNNGRLQYEWAISTGKPGDDTPNGSYMTVEKHNPERMVGPGYDLEVPWSVRFTYTGDFIHDAYWSVGQQGFENVSHGCVNVAPANAQTYYNMAVPGDPVTVSGSPSAGKWDNGWTEWFLPWQQYLKGSALHEAVQAGPGGSFFVDPSSLLASSASAPLQTPPLHNWEAS